MFTTALHLTGIFRVRWLMSFCFILFHSIESPSNGCYLALTRNFVVKCICSICPKRVQLDLNMVIVQVMVQPQFHDLREMLTFMNHSEKKSLVLSPRVLVPQNIILLLLSTDLLDCSKSFNVTRSSPYSFSSYIWFKSKSSLIHK